MALSRRSGQRFQASIWPGFVDAMTALLLVLIFVLTIFMVVQSIQSEEILGQETELDRLTARVTELGRALGVEQQRAVELEDQVVGLNDALEGAQSEAALQEALMAALAARAQRQAEDMGDLETQVATLLADRDAALGIIDELEGDLQTSESARVEAMDQAAALDLALAQARDEIDAGTEAARLDAARREALEAMIADLEAREAELTAQSDAQAAEQAEALSEAEAARLAEAAAAEALRDRLANADAELTSLSLALEAERQEAEDTLTLLAAAELARDRAQAARAEAEAARAEALAALTDAEAARALSAGTAEDAATARAAAEAALAEAEARRAEAEAQAEAALSEADRREALLAAADRAIAEADAASADAARDMALLNQQVADLREQLGNLQGLLDASEARDSEAQVQIEALGTRLNAALAQAASEQRRRADLEEAERIRLEEETARLAEEAQRLETYRSDFFGRLREVLGDLEGVQIVGDRFVFSSEVLFESGSAQLSFEGAAEIAKVGAVLRDVSADLPEELNWIIRVDGHTDDVPLTGGGRFRDNWELSQGRALSVVQFLIDAYGFPPDRLAATGFAEFQPVDASDTPEARARNRRIEIKLTER
ncbi:MAG: peptidoglycan -binding protein [Rhodobacteraceae bacterium]|nr:peptidoglycan -binding protein [Paracoccaceae bacterium]